MKRKLLTTLTAIRELLDALRGGKVIIPITEPLQHMLDDIAAPSKLNALVFPNIRWNQEHEQGGNDKPATGTK